MIKKILKYAAITIAVFVVALLSSALLYRKYLQHKTAEARAITSANGIDSLEAVRIGGIEQWIEVRGQDVNNPILLFIHGGPGIAFIPLAGSFDGEWEKHFTVVQWDQRGAGKTYTSSDREALRSTMNIPQMEQDTLEVVNYLRARFKREKIFIVGHSWGSILGLWLAHQHPELIYAYVGTGQVVSMAKNDATGYEEALRQARENHNEQAVTELESIAPYPPPSVDFKKQSIARGWEAQLLGPPADTPDFTDLPRILKDVVSTPEYSLRDDFSFVRGVQMSGSPMLPQLMNVDLEKLGPDFRTPIFFFEGRHDTFCLSSLTQEYSESINAPQKEVVWFKHSGHFPFFEERQKFADELLERVLLLAN